MPMLIATRIYTTIFCPNLAGMQCGDASGTGVFDTANRVFDKERMSSIDSSLHTFFPDLIGPNDVRFSQAALQPETLVLNVVLYCWRLMSAASLMKLRWPVQCQGMVFRTPTKRHAPNSVCHEILTAFAMRSLRICQVPQHSSRLKLAQACHSKIRDRVW